MSVRAEPMAGHKEVQEPLVMAMTFDEQHIFTKGNRMAISKKIIF